MKRILPLLYFFYSLSSFAQVHLSFELVKEHTSKGDELLGYKTYRLYAVSDNPKDRIIAVYGSNQSPLMISSDQGFWQSALGDALGSNINPILNQTNPSYNYDSWVTINKTDKSKPGQLFILESPSQSWVAPFEAGGKIAIDDKIGGSWFMMPNDKNTFTGEAGKVLLGQFTVKGKISAQLNLQVMLGSTGAAESINGLKAETP
jgi:hypothetical protein